MLNKNILKDKTELLDSFMNDLVYFLENIPKYGQEEFGFYLLENINQSINYFQDIGLIIFSKSFLSERILFYQIGDSN